MLVEDEARKKHKLIESKLNIKNTAVIYSVSQLFNCSVMLKALLELVEQFFPMFFDFTSFLELDFKHILKIVSTSELNIDSEMEVFNAVVSWLGHKKERSKYAMIFS